MKKLLIVEDEQPLLKILMDEFKEEGYNVIGAEDGEIGLNLAVSERPDLIVLDLVMPKMDGIAVLKKLRQDEWGKKAPVVILTNLEGDTRKTVQALQNGVFEFFVKTRWSLDELKKRIKEKIEAETGNEENII